MINKFYSITLELKDIPEEIDNIFTPAEIMECMCTYFKEQGDDPAICERAIRRCIQDYDDEDFCKKTLWGKRKPNS